MESFLINLSTGLLLIILSIVIYSKYIYSHWKRNKIVQLDPVFPFGDTKSIICKQESQGITFQNIYNELKKKNVPYGGFYYTLHPELMILDPNVLKQIMIKDFQHFVDRGAFHDEANDPLTANLFNIDGKQWKDMRTQLSPTFTSGKMKMMFNILVACAQELNNILFEKCSKSEPLDIKDILSRFTTDVIGSCAFGIECNCLKDPNTSFRKYGQQRFDPTGVIDKFRDVLAHIMPNILKFFKITMLNKDISNFFIDVVKSTVQYREENNIARNDFMHLLLQLRNHGEVMDEGEKEFKNIFRSNEKPNLTIEQIAAHCFLFFVAGFETSSTAMTFCLYELSKNQEAQDKLREEIRFTLEKHNGKLTYEAIMQMRYMESVINEALRKYPSLPFLIRRCTADYKLTDSDYIIRKGDYIRISILGFHKDPEYYPDPEKFDPNRFSDEEKSKIHPFTYFPFGEGPRVCIGQRFGMMQMKVGLTTLLKDYRFTLNKKTVEPLKMDPNNFILSTVGGIWLDVQKV